jgi:hypothetical protein
MQSKLSKHTLWAATEPTRRLRKRVVNCISMVFEEVMGLFETKVFC